MVGLAAEVGQIDPVPESVEREVSLESETLKSHGTPDGSVYVPTKTAPNPEGPGDFAKDVLGIEDRARRESTRTSVVDVTIANLFL